MVECPPPKRDVKGSNPFAPAECSFMREVIIFEELVVVLQKNADTLVLLLVETEGRYPSQQIRLEKIIQKLQADKEGGTLK